MKYRKKKKLLKTKVKHAQPRDIILFEFDLNDENMDMELACRLFEAYTKVLPKDVFAALVPKNLNVQIYDSNDFRQYIDRLEDEYNKFQKGVGYETN